MTHLPHPQAPRPGQEGSTLLFALLILGALAILAGTVAVVSMGDRNLSRYSRDSLQALAAAETGVAYAKRTIINQTGTFVDYDTDGRPDFALADSLDWGGTYHTIAEGSDILEPGVAAYHCNGFSIVSEGRYRGAVRRVRVEIVHDTFLKFARYVSQQGLQFECGDVMAGEVYCGNSISLSCGCSPGQEPHFLERVYAVGNIPQASCGVFERGYEEGIDAIDMLASIDWNQIRMKARGLASNSSCEGTGIIGIYSDLANGIDPLHLATQGGSDVNTVVYDYFDFANASLSPPDTVITYRGFALMNTITGTNLRKQDFNGIVFFEGDARVRGTLDGVSAFRMSVFGTDRGLFEGDVVCGRTGFDPVTRLPDHSGQPMTTALVAENYVAMDEATKRVLRIDAAIFSRTSNWRCLGGMGLHPIAGPGPLDLDLDGVAGETPYNNDPVAGEGWDELNITEHTWVLNLNGPIVTYSGGDAYPWNAGPVLGNASGPTRRYNYDLNYMHNPPACFPVPANLWIDVSWTEIADANEPLASYLPF